MAIVKGVWEFKDRGSFTAPAQDVEQYVNFTTAEGDSFNGMKVFSFTSSDEPVLLSFGFGEGCHTVAIYNDNEGASFAWVEKEGFVGDREVKDYKTIDFGTIGQEVSDEFYAVFTQIAKETLSSKLVRVAENQQRVYDAGYAAGQAAGGGSLGGLPTYETDVNFVGNVAYVYLTHNLNTKKLLVIGRVREHDGTDLGTYKISQLVAWSPEAYFQNAEYNLSNGGTYNPYEYFVKGDVATGAYIAFVHNGNATATVPNAATSLRKGSAAFSENTGNRICVAPNGSFLTNATWHFTVVDVSSIM